MVTILSLAFTAESGTEQERCTSPLTCTEQAPHCATPQPYFVPVRPTCSRITHRSGVPASTCTSRTLPLIFSFAMTSSLTRQRILYLGTRPCYLTGSSQTSHERFCRNCASSLKSAASVSSAEDTVFATTAFCSSRSLSE